jgi:phospholipid-binding lipoprotein MlaA
MFGLIAAAGVPGTAAFADSGKPAHASSVAGDPFQGFNRGSFAVHQFLDHYFLRPVAMTYARLMPKPLREGIGNVVSNLREPVVAANDVLQLRPRKAGITIARFAANSTIGVLGVFDVATGMGAPHHDNDFGLTLGRAHAGPGPYLFIPLAGPTTVRDLAGVVVDVALDPLHWIRYRYSTEISVARFVSGGLDTRIKVDPDLQALLGNATDPYATLRSAYLQNRQSQVDDNGSGAQPALPDFADQPDTAPPPTPAAPASASTSPASGDAASVPPSSAAPSSSSSSPAPSTPSGAAAPAGTDVKASPAPAT